LSDFALPAGWRNTMTFDFGKIERQLRASYNASRKPLREHLSFHLSDVYRHLQRGDLKAAESSLLEFDMAAKELGWQGGGSQLPRPFNHKHLEWLYWDARKAVRGAGRPPPAQRMRDDDYSKIHLNSKIAQPAGQVQVRKPPDRRPDARPQGRFSGRR
jgi:hypothetical protein